MIYNKGRTKRNDRKRLLSLHFFRRFMRRGVPKTTCKRKRERDENNRSLVRDITKRRSFFFFFFYRRMKVSLRSIPAGACEIADSLCGYYRKCAFVAQDTRQRILKFKRRAPTDESVRFSVAVEPFLPESKTHLAFILF